MTTQITPAPTIRLANGVEMPHLGLGTWPMTDAEAATTVRDAIDMGYRLIDTAENYKNETGVGEGVRAASIPREDIFVTTKFNREWHSVDGVRKTCEASLKRLGLDHIDLLLIHWPNPDQNQYVDAFDGLTRVLEAGLVRAIGTSNFKPAHLQKLFDAGFAPHVNQIKLDPYVRRDDITKIDADHGIVTECWSPIKYEGLLSDPKITAIAEAHNATPGQIVLRWHTQNTWVPIPKSSNPGRLAQNLDSFRITLSDDDLAVIDSLGKATPKMTDADTFGH
jgi:2,5-diketo-D-gluconate reductase A